MPGTISSDFTTIDAADATTNWLTLGTWAAAPVANVDMKIQGTNALVGRVSAAEAFTLASTTAVDLTTGGKHVFIWVKNVTWPGTDTKANGGVRVCLSSDLTPTLVGTAPNDGPSNGKTWFVAGTDTDSITGWVCYVVDPQSTANVTNGTPVMTGVQRVGMGSKILNVVGGGSFKPVNLLVDIVKYGTGLVITAGTSGAPVALVDIFTADSLNANAYGVLTKFSGVYYGAGKFNFGTAAQAAITYFQDTNQVLVFQDFPVANTFYEILTAGAASFITTVQFGSFVSNIASGGCTIKGSGNAVWTLTAGGANSVFNAYASLFSQMRRGTLNSSAVLRSCTFDTCGEVTPAGATIDSCTFQNVSTAAPVSGTWALIINATTDVTSKITNSKFINCNKAIKINTAGTYTFDNLKFSGNTFDIENASTGLVTINAINGANPATVTNTGAGATTTINNAVTLKVTVSDAVTGAAIQNARVAVYKTGNILAGQELINALTDATGVVTTTFNYSVDQGIVVRIRSESPPATRYFPIDATGTITINGYTASFTMISDPIAATVVL